MSKHPTSRRNNSKFQPRPESRSGRNGQNRSGDNSGGVLGKMVAAPSRSPQESSLQRRRPDQPNLEDFTFDFEKSGKNISAKMASTFDNESPVKFNPNGKPKVGNKKPSRANTSISVLMGSRTVPAITAPLARQHVSALRSRDEPKRPLSSTNSALSSRQQTNRKAGQSNGNRAMGILNRLNLLQQSNSEPRTHRPATPAYRLKMAQYNNLSSDEEDEGQVLVVADLSRNSEDENSASSGRGRKRQRFDKAHDEPRTYRHNQQQKHYQQQHQQRQRQHASYKTSAASMNQDRNNIRPERRQGANYMKIVEEKTDMEDAKRRGQHGTTRQQSTIDVDDETKRCNMNNSMSQKRYLRSAGTVTDTNVDSKRISAKKKKSPTQFRIDVYDDISECSDESVSKAKLNKNYNFAKKYPEAHKHELTAERPNPSQLTIVTQKATIRKSTQNSMSMADPIPRKSSNIGRPTNTGRASLDSQRSSVAQPTPRDIAASRTGGVPHERQAPQRTLSLTKVNLSRGTPARRKKSKGTPVIPGETFTEETPSRDLYYPPHPSEIPLRRSERNRGSNSSSSKKRKGDNSIIELLSDDEEEESLLDDSNNQISPGQTKPRASKPVVIPVPRIAIGKKELDTGCKLGFQDGILQLEGEQKKTKTKTKHFITLDLEDDSIKMIKYFRAGAGAGDAPEDLTGENDTFNTFLAMEVMPNDDNRLKTFSNAYQFQGDDNKRYIVIEFRDDIALLKLLTCFEGTAAFAYIKDGPSKEDASSFCAALIKPPSSGKRTSRRGKTKVTDKFVAGRPKDEILLVYPFAGNPDEMEKAAAGLAEASGELFAAQTEIAMEVPAMASSTSDDDDDEEIGQIDSSSSNDSVSSTKASGGNAAVTKKTQHRRHYLTIQVRDFERLCPGEFLNDTLIDFWMQWITRKSDQQGSKVHCFSSHFFTTLDDEGVEAVKKWTAKRGINVFEKKFVFIPVNEMLHWSLCVVVNPGHIMENRNGDPFSCLLFLDSLKAHQKSKIERKVRAWLNSEWQTLKEVECKPFSNKSHFPLLTPEIPYQDNSWDCGVFVCRYAYSVYSLRHEDFCCGDLWFAQNLIDHCDEFQFGMEDIARLRDDIRELIERLSHIYLPWKREHDKALKLEARQAKKQRMRQSAAAAAALSTIEEQVEENLPLLASDAACSHDQTAHRDDAGASKEEAGHDSVAMLPQANPVGDSSGALDDNNPCVCPNGESMDVDSSNSASDRMELDEPVEDVHHTSVFEPTTAPSHLVSDDPIGDAAESGKENTQSYPGSAFKKRAAHEHTQISGFDAPIQTRASRTKSNPTSNLVFIGPHNRSATSSSEKGRIAARGEARLDHI